MTLISITDITVRNNPARFGDPYIFQITFECITELQDDIEWKLIYVGSAESSSYDQELDSCMVGPVPLGVNSFEFEAAAPAVSTIKPEDLLGVTVLLLTASYKDREFVRIGYYVHTEYETEELRNCEPPPDPPQWDKLVRSVLSEKPRVTRFNIQW